jgi:hypothetical protein
MGKNVDLWRQAKKDLDVLLHDIRVHCADCSGESTDELKYCSAVDCALWPWRFGVPPAEVVEKGLLDKTLFQEGGKFGPDKAVEEIET